MEVEGAAPDKALAAARVAVDSCAAVESAPVATGVEDGGAPGRGLAAYLHQEHGRAVAATLGWNMVRLETKCCCCCRPTTAQRYSCLATAASHTNITLQCCSMNAAGIFDGCSCAINCWASTACKTFASHLLLLEAGCLGVLFEALAGPAPVSLLPMPLSTLANDLGNPDAAAPASGLTAGGGVWGAKPGVLAVGADACGSLLNTGDDD